MTELDYCVDYVVLIAGRKHEDDILKLLTHSGCHLVNIVYGKGSVQSGYFKDMLGLVPEEKKIMITCLVAGNCTNQLFDQLITQFHFDKPNTGIAFTIPVDRLSV